MPTCLKVPYPNAHAAALALRRIRSDPRRAESGIHPCFHGHVGWHLTSKASAARNKWTIEAVRAGTL